jgi:hypothetical protein
MNSNMSDGPGRPVLFLALSGSKGTPLFVSKKKKKKKKKFIMDIKT